MPGKYYLKHMVYRSFDNAQKVNNLNDNYKSIIRLNAVDYLRRTNDSTDEKVQYLKGLTHDVYRHGRKYKYDCSLSNADISEIIRTVQDDELHQAYFGTTIKEQDSKNNTYLVVLLVGLLIFVIFILHTCSP
jgi:hypothetical protein